MNLTTVVATDYGLNEGYFDWFLESRRKILSVELSTAMTIGQIGKS